MRARIFVRGSVGPSVGASVALSVGPPVDPSVDPSRICKKKNKIPNKELPEEFYTLDPS